MDCSYGQDVDCSYGQDVDCSYGQDVDCSYGQDVDCSYGQDVDYSCGQDVDYSYGQDVDLESKAVQDSVVFNWEWKKCIGEEKVTFIPDSFRKADKCFVRNMPGWHSE